MGLFSGWQSTVQSAAQTVANLAGQAVSMLSLTLTQTTGNVALQMTTGAKAKFGGGTNDFITSDGANTLTAGANFGASNYQMGGSFTFSQGNGAGGSTDSRGNVSDLAGNMAQVAGNTTAMTAGVDRFIYGFARDLFSNFVAKVCTDGSYQNLGVAGTAGSGTGITTNATAIGGRTVVHKITLINTALTAAAATQDITLWTVPARTRIMRVVADCTVGFTGGALTNMQVTIGSSAGDNGYMPISTVFASGTFGTAAASIGSKLLSATYADFPNWSSTNIVNVRFTGTTANVNAATAGSVTFYIEAVTYP